MKPDPAKLLSILDMSLPLAGFYDTPDKGLFEPYATARQCVFSCWQDWMQGKSTWLSQQNLGAIQCPGAGYWNCNVATMPSDRVASFLAEEQGLKASPDLMCQWLANQRPYKKENDYIVIGPLQRAQYDYLKTITFYGNPDQISMLITGAEYRNGSASYHPVTAAFGTGCGQLAAVFTDFDRPQAVIGGTDIAARPYLPRDILAFTVTKPMFEQLCQLDEKSFLHKSFWHNLRQARDGRSPKKERRS